MRHILEVLGLCLCQENSLNIPVLPETSFPDHVAPIEENRRKEDRKTKKRSLK